MGSFYAAWGRVIRNVVPVLPSVLEVLKRTVPPCLAMMRLESQRPKLMPDALLVTSAMMTLMPTSPSVPAKAPSPQRCGDGRRQRIAGCSREETSSLNQAISLSLLSSKGYRRELLLSLWLLSLDRRTLLSLLPRQRVSEGRSELGLD